MRWARESSSSAARRLEPDERCLKSDEEHQRWADHGNGFSSPQGARGSYRRREVLEDVATRVGTPKGRSTEAGDANTVVTHRVRRREPRGLERAPQLTFLVHEHAAREPLP